LDTSTGTPGGQRNWALWAALAMVAAGAIAVLYVLFAAASKPETASGLSRFATGEMTRLTVMEAPPPLPTRTLQDAAGADVTLAELRGQVMVVNLWATWCAPCVEEMPTLGALQRRFGDRIRVVAISADSEADRQKARTQLAQLTDNTLPFYIDISRGVLFDAQAPGMPVTIIYDRSGAEVARLAGGADWGGDDAAGVIEAVLAPN
jgi:thiol-disulfide isomerase/thioredoxin